jgi:uncharacterized protein (DUF2062 family)
VGGAWTSLAAAARLRHLGRRQVLGVIESVMYRRCRADTWWEFHMPRPLLQDQAFCPAVVLPTFNNAGTLVNVLDRVAALRLAMIVVNDGSTDETARRLDTWRNQHGDAQLLLVAHPANRGKGQALVSGFAAATSGGFSHVVSIDTDGQLDPEDIPHVLEAARQSPASLIIGTRNDRQPDYPPRSRLGRRFSNGLIRLECGRRVSDSQCGFRVYPLALMRIVTCRSRGFGFESEVIVRAVWAGWPVHELPVRVRYLPKPERVSHFKPWRDSFRIAGLHARLLAVAFTPGRRAPGQPCRSPWWWRLWKWMSPAELVRAIRQTPAERNKVALSLAVGVWVANLPAYGFQTLLALLLSRLLHVHPLPAVAASQVSTPPLNVLLIAAGIGVGHRILHGYWPSTLAALGVGQAWHATTVSLMAEWVVGSVVVGFVMAAVTFGLARLALQLVPRSREAGPLFAGPRLPQSETTAASR